MRYSIFDPFMFFVPSLQVIKCLFEWLGLMILFFERMYLDFNELNAMYQENRENLFVVLLEK